MPYSFLFIMVAFLLIPVCFVGTFIFCLVLLSFLYKSSSRKLRVIKIILLSGLLAFLAAIVIPASVVLLGGVCVCMDSMYAWDYWRYNGVLDSFRMPLEPPYELLMIDTIDYASIEVWKEDSTSQLSGITHYEKRGYLIFGEISKEKFDSRRTEEDRKWFIFDLSNGDKSIFESEEDFAAELANRGVESIKLKTVLQNWNEYWEHPRRKASEKPKDVKK
jgi:energy-coupling factor transporter transmembrane protein EcfT